MGNRNMPGMKTSGFEDSDFGEVEWLRPEPTRPVSRTFVWTGVAIAATPLAVALVHLLRSYA